MSHRPFDPSRRPPQQAVRVGHFEKAMEDFNGEIGHKVAMTLEKYHKTFVHPLEIRLIELERPWWERLANKLRSTTMPRRRGNS